MDFAAFEEGVAGRDVRRELSDSQRSRAALPPVFPMENDTGRSARPCRLGFQTMLRTVKLL